MKAIILAAGYATRLYPLTKNKPKALLEVANKTVLDYIIDEIETIKEINEIIIISNHKFIEQFNAWKSNRLSNIEIKIIDDGTVSDEEKLGAIGDIQLVIEKEKINEAVLVIAGDNLFTFKLLDFYKHFKSVHEDCIIVKKIENQEELKRMGVVSLDINNNVINFEEKPLHPRSDIAVFASYIYLKETIPMFKQYLTEGNKPDAPGYFPAWLYKKKKINTYFLKGECFDIGTHESYKEVQEKFEGFIKSEEPLK